VTVLKNDTAKFKAALRKYLHTHSLYSVDEFFVCKDDLQYSCSVLHCEFLYLYIYDLFHNLLYL